MTPSPRKIRAPVVVLLGVLLLACAPTRPPGDQLAAAARSLADAQAAGASTYATAELAAAQERLDRARTAQAEHDDDRAAQLALEAQAAADLAAGKSRLGKARAAVETLEQQNAALQRNLESDGGGQEP